MREKTGALLALLAVLLLLAGGCTGQDAVPPVTPSPEATPTETATVTTIPTTPTATPAPFPGALHLKEVYRYGREHVACEVTIYRAFFRDEYDWWSRDWGRYWNTTPSEGNRFLFVFIRYLNNGTTQAILPSSDKFVVHADGLTYRYYTERDPSIPILGINEKGWENPLDYRGGWIYPGPSNTVEGFLIYEVPRDLPPERIYVDGVFSGQARAVWKLG
ncbi:MAG: DUF4352 domain-containing protein [Methanomicrobiales archaeon]|nr:DUF4352 domain-containing protein [Methanomicrobiales archaeon]